MARKRPTPATAATPWLFNAPIDLFIGAGAWTIPLLVVTWLASRNGGIDVVFAFTALTLVCNHPHYMATVYRAYNDRAALLRHRRYTVGATVVLAVVLIAAHALPMLRPLIFSAYVFWSPWHYSGQNFGLALMFAHRNGAAPTARERTVLFLGFVAAYVIWLLAMHGQPSDDPYVLSLALDARIVDVSAALLALCMLCSFAAVPARLARRSSVRAVAPLFVLCLTQTLWFVAPWFVAVAGGGRSPSVYYTTGVLAFMHCAQYLWITTFYERQSARRSGKEIWDSGRYAAILVLGGIALFIPGPWIASSLAGIDLRESLIIFTAIVNLHHFVLDGALWKLRDRSVATVLLEPGPPRSHAAPATVPRLRPALRWAFAMALIVVAGADLFQRALTRDSATDRSLALARALNHNDSRVDVRRAALLARTQHDAAIDLLQPIVAANPLHAPARRMLGALYVTEGRWSDADAQYGALAESGGLDAASYVNLGVLRARARDVGGAESAFRHALALDDRSADAHLNLGESLVQQGRRAEAIPHYESYLVLADPFDEPAQRVYLLAALKLAEAQAHQGNANAALAVLERTARTAEHIKAWDLTMLARAQAAQLLEASNDPAAAEPQYQMAIAAAQHGEDRDREDRLRARYDAYLASRR